MELEEIIKPYSLAPDTAKRQGPENAHLTGGNSKRHQTDGGAVAGDAGGPPGKVSLDDLPDEIDASAVEKILEQADEVRYCTRSLRCRLHSSVSRANAGLALATFVLYRRPNSIQQTRSLICSSGLAACCSGSRRGDYGGVNKTMRCAT